jgi:hypothetical protein
MNNPLDISLKELKECRKAFEEYYSQWDDVSMIVDPRPGGSKHTKNFVNQMTQARWCAWLMGWTYRAAIK